MTNRFRNARVAAAMTQEHLAAAAEVSISTVRRLESGDSVSPESRRAVAAVLGIQAGEDVTSGGKLRVVELPKEDYSFIRRKHKRTVDICYGIWTSIVLVCLIGALLSGPEAWQLGNGWTFLACAFGLVTLVGVPFLLVMGSNYWRLPVIPLLMAISTTTTAPFLHLAGIVDLGSGSVAWLAFLFGFFMIRTTFDSVGVTAATKRIGGSPRNLCIKQAEATGDRIVFV